MNYHCKKVYTNISTNMETTNIVPLFSIFAQNCYYYPPKKSNFGHIQLVILAYIVSKVMNYDYANFLLLSKS